tara:strand:+ start:56 stop:574 length:519 start_codon:yes stop_codon:yes gene_type:complete
LKLIIYFFTFVFFSLNINAQNIATIRLSYIINNSNEFQTFLIKLDKIKSKYFDELKNEEKQLEKRKIEIENSKILFNEDEYSKLVNIFDDNANKYLIKVEKIENYLNNNIKINEKIILKTISLIIEEYSQKNKLDVILNEDQYFISSGSLDISDIIIEELNKKKLDLKISEK